MKYVNIMKEYRSKMDTDIQVRYLTEDPIECSLDSIFTWFLRSVMIRRRLDDSCLRTLTLISQVNDMTSFIIPPPPRPLVRNQEKKKKIVILTKRTLQS